MFLRLRAHLQGRNLELHDFFFPRHHNTLLLSTPSTLSTVLTFVESLTIVVSHSSPMRWIRRRAGVCGAFSLKCLRSRLASHRRTQPAVFASCVQYPHPFISREPRIHSAVCRFILLTQKGEMHAAITSTTESATRRPSSPDVVWRAQSNESMASWLGGPGVRW